MSEDTSPSSSTPNSPETVANNPSTKLKVYCPHCRSSFQADPDSNLSDLACLRCGAQFSIVGESDSSTVTHSMVRKTVAQFDLIDELGSGGFGRVWLAHDRQLDRTVAVKIPHAKKMVGDNAEWFFREARAAAQLQHPNIVSVFEIGRSDNEVYIVSEFVRGTTLNHWLSGRNLTSREAASICVTIAQALQHAHDAGIIHRDLKPGNILVDRDGNPRITDFGLAKRESGDPTLTVDGKIIGTPSYMSPEQALGHAHRATPSSDVYSLGVILFEMLTNVRPFRGKSNLVLHQVVHDDAPPLRSFDRTIPLDLEAICLKCLEKAPAQRYVSMTDLAEELQRFLAGKPVTARRVTRFNRAWRWCKRNPVVSALAASLLFVLLTGLASTTVLWKRSETARAQAEESRTTMRDNLYTAQMEVIRQAFWRGDIQQMEKLLEGYIPQSAGEPDLRSFAWYYYWGRCRRFSHLLDHGAHVLGLCLSADGNRLVSAGRDEVLRVWDLDTSTVLTELDGSSMLRRCDVAMSNDGRWIVSASDEDVIRVWDAETGDSRTLEGGGIAIAFSDDGDRLACVNSDGTARIFDTENWQVQDSSLGRRMTTRVAGISRDLSRCVVANRRGSIFVVDLRSGDFHEIESSRLETVWSIATSPDGSEIAAGYMGEIRLIDSSTGTLTRTLTGHLGPIGSLTYSPDGRLLASACNDGTAKLWDPKNGELLATFNEHIWPISNGFVQFSPDGSTLTSGSADGTIKVWEVRNDEPKDVWEAHDGRVESVCFTHDSAALVSGGTDHRIRLWEPRTGTVKRVFEGHTDTVFDVKCSPDGRTIASASGDGTVCVWSAGSGRRIHQLRGHQSEVKSVAFSPDGKSLASAGVDRTVRLWSVATGDELHVLGEHTDSVRAVTFLGTGGRLASAGLDSTIRIWDATSGDLLDTLKGHSRGVRCLSVSPDHQWLASGGEDRTVRLWNLQTGELTRTLGGHAGIVNTVAFCPDGRTLASSGLGRAVRLWDLRTGETQARLNQSANSKQVHSVAFSPDGATLAAGSLDEKIRLWRAGDGYAAAQRQSQ